MDCCSKNHKVHDQQTEKPTKLEHVSIMSKIGNSKMQILFVCIVVAIVAITILKLLRIPFGTLFPYAVFLLCPLLHIFMMGGHSDHNKENTPKP